MMLHVVVPFSYSQTERARDLLHLWEDNKNNPLFQTERGVNAMVDACGTNCSTLSRSSFTTACFPGFTNQMGLAEQVWFHVEKNLKMAHHVRVSMSLSSSVFRPLAPAPRHPSLLLLLFSRITTRRWWKGTCATATIRRGPSCSTQSRTVCCIFF